MAGNLTPDDFPPIEEVFGEDGLLSELWPDYEFRPQQLSMAKQVEASLKNGEQLIIEAGTGVGKTLGYLYPLLKFHAGGGGIGLVATATKALQQQILDKDLPVIEELIGKKVPAEVCLGASNFVCPRRLRSAQSNWQADEEAGEPPGEKLAKARAKFLDWEATTETGLFSEANFSVNQSLVEASHRDPENCLGRRCSLFQQSYYFQARNRWTQAALLIANHHLLCYHLLAEGGMFPDTGAIVIDEAHNFPGTMLSISRISLSVKVIEKILNPLLKSDRFSDDSSFVSALGTDKRDELRSAAQTYFVQIVDLFKTIYTQLPLFESDIRLKSPLDIDFETPASFIRARKIFAAYTDSSDTEDKAKDAELFWGRWAKFQENLETFILQSESHSDFVYWAEKDDDTVTLYLSPINSGKWISATGLSQGPLISTSATLSVGKNIGYYEKQLGLKAGQSDVLPSPFPYLSNAILYLPRNMHHPSKEREEFTDDLKLLLPRLLELTEGGAFVLFTARTMLEEMYEFLMDELDDDYPIISQTEYGAVTAYRDYLEAENGVLLGLNSFWEGVDVKGHQLRHVILVKLPFQVPTEPIRQAQTEQIEAAGRNAFMEQQVPEAIIRFKQGFGRLMRSNTDKGIISVLDSRLTSTRYGSMFLESIPQTQVARSYGQLRQLHSQLYEE